MPNFTRFLTDPQFALFTEAAVTAEKVYAIDLASCAFNCRRAMEFAVKWMYPVDGALVMPWDDRLVSLMDAENFRDIVGEDLWRRLKYIRQTGNAAAHTGQKIPCYQARLCPGLIAGEDKTKFYIFDLCGNFEFFRMSKGKATANQVEEMFFKVQELDRGNFAVRQHLRYVEKFSNPESYQALTYEDTLYLRDEVAPLLRPDGDEASAVRFDALMYGIELAYLVGKPYKRARKGLVKEVTAIAGVANIPLTGSDVKKLEHILWSQVDTRQDYEAEMGAKPLSKFVREIVDLDIGSSWTCRLYRRG